MLVSLLIAAAIKDQQLATAVLRCTRICIDELHEYGDLPDDFSNEMKTNRACIKREHSSEQFFSRDSKNEEAHISV